MAAPVIPILSDSSEESVVLELVDYSSFDSDPSEDSLPPTPELPLVSPFLCSDDSEADNESEPAEVTSRLSSPSKSSSHDTFTPSSEFPIAPVVAPPGLLTARKRVGPFPAWRRVSYRSSYRHSLPDFTLDSSSSGSSSDSSSDTSSGTPLDSLSAPISTPYPPTTSKSSPNSFSERSLDSSSLFVGPSHKRCRSLTTSVSSSTPVSKSIAPTHADLLPPRKRFRESYSPEDSREEHMKIGTADAEAIADLGIGDGVDTEDGIGIGVEIAASDIREDEEEFEAEVSAGGTMEIVVDPLVTSGISESTRGDVPDLEDTLYDIVHYMLEVPLDRITEFPAAADYSLGDE
ncbi:hypothetical protein Tco_0246890 [Tanacetum coccineum]